MYVCLGALSTESSGTIKHERGVNDSGDGSTNPNCDLLSDNTRSKCVPSLPVVLGAADGT